MQMAAQDSVNTFGVLLGGLNAHWNQWSNCAGLLPNFSDHSHHDEKSQFGT